MKIGFDAKRLYNNFTGLGNHSRTTIDILTTAFPEDQYILYTPSIRRNAVTAPYLKNKCCITEKPHGIIRGSLWRSGSIVNDLKRDGVDLFHGLSNELPVGISSSGIPSVVTIHDVAFKTFPDMYHRIDRLIYDMKWRYACGHSDRIIAISECTKQDIMKFYGVRADKIDVVYQPVTPIYYEDYKVDDDIPEELSQPYMLYVGSINSRKNLLGIVKAMERLPKELQLPLLVVGDGGSYKRRVTAYIEEHNMRHLFKWMGPVDNKELRRMYSHAVAFVYPSFYEGFGLPVVEAQLCGCPVVTSNVSSLPEAGGPYSITVDPNSTEEIADAMIKLLSDDRLRDKMSEGGRKYAMENFHPTVLANKLMDVYRKVVKSN